MGSDRIVAAARRWYRRFNPRSHVGSDSKMFWTKAIVLVFQSTLPRGERLLAVETSYAQTTSQSTLPRGERLLPLSEAVLLIRFQSTLPRGERRTCAYHPARCPKFQSTLPHGERRQYDGRHDANDGFNPRSHMGSDLPSLIVTADTVCFNPRSHMGSDPAMSSSVRLSKFQSTLPHGERLHGVIQVFRLYQFQSTLPHGERLEKSAFITLNGSFNPRSHMGSDVSTEKQTLEQQVSIHAPTWGATLFHLSCGCTFHVSIHAPTWGATATEYYGGS